MCTDSIHPANRGWRLRAVLVIIRVSVVQSDSKQSDSQQQTYRTGQMGFGQVSLESADATFHLPEGGT